MHIFSARLRLSWLSVVTSELLAKDLGTLNLEKKNEEFFVSDRMGKPIFI